MKHLALLAAAVSVLLATPAQAQTAFPADVETLQGKLRLGPELAAEWRLGQKRAVVPRVMTSETFIPAPARR